MAVLSLVTPMLRKWHIVLVFISAFCVADIARLLPFHICFRPRLVQNPDYTTRTTH